MNKLIGKINPTRVIAKSGLFDSYWYEKQYGIPKEKAAEHYLKTGYKLGYEPSKKFSGVDYLVCNPDVSIMNPLYHYEMWGRKEKRILQTDAMKMATTQPVEQMPLYSNRFVYTTKFDKNIKTCAIMAMYSNEETIPDYVAYYIKKLKEEVDCVILIAGNYLKKTSDFNKVKDIVSHAEFIKHNTYDFGAYKRGIEVLQENGILENLNELYLVNDSCYGPITSFKNVIEEMRTRDCDFWGLLDSDDKKKYHLLSFFYCFKNNVIKDPMFCSFFGRVRENMTLDYVVMNLELELTEYLSKKYKGDVYFDSYCDNALKVVTGSKNASYWPLKIIKNGFPLVKIKALDGRYGLQTRDNPSEVLKFIKEKNPELCNLIEKDLKTRRKKGAFLEDPDIFDIIDEKEIVSFDVLDTLLIRPFASPVDVFNYMEEKYKAKDFAYYRIKAEERARAQEQSKEVTLTEIYNQMPYEYGWLEYLEKKEELEKIEPNPRIHYLYEYALTSGKKLVATTDMYLPSELIRRMLDKCGFEKIEKIYVSGEYKKSKANGSLFRVVLKDLGSDGTNIVHLGDNIESDVQRPKEYNMESMRIQRNYDAFMESPSNVKYLQYWIAKPNLRKSIHLSMLTNRFAKTKEGSSFFEELGYYVGGPLALSYLHFICETAKKNELDMLMFAARDGYLLKEMYEKYFYQQYKIPTSYAYLSRAVILSSTLNYQKDPVYLRTILLMAKEHVKGIYVYKNDEDNRAEYKKHKGEIQKWAQGNLVNVRKHLNSIAGDAKSIGIVDMTTGLFTSLTGARDILGERVKMGMFTGALTNKSKYPYKTFLVGPLEYADYDLEKLLSLSEVLITSPEDGIVGIDGDGNPIYEAKEKGRAHRYDEVKKGVEAYIVDFKNRFEIEDYTLLTFRDWLELAGNYMKYKNPVDDDGLNAITFRTQPIDKQKEIKLSE